MDQFKKYLKEEIPKFKQMGEKFLSKEISKMDFKKFSGGYGVYAHRDQSTFMIRLRTPSGTITFDELKFLYEEAKKYNLDGIHLTTRQAVQFHGLSIEETCNLMNEGIDYNLFSRGAGGNFPRNVAMSPLSGVDPNEAFDVTPYAIAANNYFLKDIYNYKLPRKLKVSMSSSYTDEGHCTIQDLGFVAVLKDNKQYFQIYLGGGLGRNPKLAITYPDLIEPKECLYAIRAMVELFKSEGDYENHNKARVRYILDRMGNEAFIDAFKKHFEESKSKGDLDLEVSPINYDRIPKEETFNSKRVFSQKQKGLYSVYYQPIGGQLKLSMLKNIIDILEGIPNPIIRLAMTEGIYFLSLNGEEAKTLLEATKQVGEDSRLFQSVSCIGVPICQMGVLESQSTLNLIIDYFKDKNLTDDILPRVHISGCPNSCGVHESSQIGLVGKKKRVDGTLHDVYEFHIGGNIGVGKASLGENLGDVLASSVPELLYTLAIYCKENNIKFENWIVESPVEVKNLISKFLV